MSKRHVITDDDLQDMWETQFKVLIASGDDGTGIRKHIILTAQRDNKVYQVKHGGVVIGEYVAMADAVGKYNTI